MGVRMNRFIAFFLTLGLSLNACGMYNPQAEIVRKITDDIKKEYQAEEPWQEINDIAQKAIKDCGITKPITILQTHGTDNAYTASKAKMHPQEFLIIGTKATIDQIIATTYHELGHVANGDVAVKQRISDDHFKWSFKGLSTSVGLGTGLVLNKYLKKPLACTAVGGLTAFSTMLAGAMSLLYKQRIMEQKADVFAYENLIKNGHLNNAIGMISDYLYTHEFNDLRPLPIVLCDHPHDIERAKTGLDILQKNGFNISHLIKNLPHDLNDGIKTHFPDQVRRFCPEFCVEKQEELK